MLEVRARLEPAAKMLLSVASGMLELRVPQDCDDDFEELIRVISNTLQGIETLAVIPREVEDILTITSSERHRWLKEGRLQSAGTRTVKLRGRARKITFHVFDPHHIEDILDRGLVDVWREQDAAVAALNRRRAAAKAALTRARRGARTVSQIQVPGKNGDTPKLKGWHEFDLDGLLK